MKTREQQIEDERKEQEKRGGNEIEGDRKGKETGQGEKENRPKIKKVRNR